MKLYDSNSYSRQVLEIKPLRAARIAALASAWLLSTLVIVTIAAPARQAITVNATNSTVRYALEGTAIAPSLAATPGDALFGDVPEGTTNTQTIQLKNTGSRNVTVTGASLSTSGYQVSGLTLPLTLAAGATTHFNLAFSPTTTGVHAGSLTVTTRSPSVPLTISISGTGIPATRTVTVTPTTLNFGSETVGKTHVLTANLKNTGNEDVTVSGISVSDSQFTTSGDVKGLTLAPGQSAPLSVIYAPTTMSTQGGAVKISSSATNSPATIAVTGTGIPGSTHSVALTWDASSSSGIIGYYLYRSTTPGNGFARLVTSPLSGLQYTDGAVQAGTTYYYVVTAVDSAGQESPRSAEAIAAVP
jgi:Abnormal spindle-like microcephaly-assoc'd, ASPM-SPD-2-Hydin